MQVLQNKMALFGLFGSLVYFKPSYLKAGIVEHVNNHSILDIYNYHIFKPTLVYV